MTQLQKGLQREIDSFLEAISQDGGRIVEVSKAAFCKARKKLKPTVFQELSNAAVQTFYNESGIDYWHGHRVLGVDGSTVTLPNSKEMEKAFGVFTTRAVNKKTCLGRMLLIHDTLNHLTLHGNIGKMTQSETELFIDAIRNQPDCKGDLFVLDRYYAYRLLYFYLASKDAQFCFRLKRNWWTPAKQFDKSEKSSEVITIELPQEDLEKAKELGIQHTTMQVRLIRVELENGETELLLTSLMDDKKYSVQAIKELYALRWPIEDAYKTLKHKMCLENFSGKSVRVVMQDFYVKIFIMNLTAITVRPINKALKKKAVKVKYVHQSNLTEALATLKRSVVSFFVTGNIKRALKACIKRIKKLTEPLRPNRSNPRNHQPKHKYRENYKMP